MTKVTTYIVPYSFIFTVADLKYAVALAAEREAAVELRKIEHDMTISYYKALYGERWEPKL